MTDCDVIIIGSGPSGTSSAFPLLEKNLLVTMLDSGTEKDVSFTQSTNKNNQSVEEKWDNLIGDNLIGLKDMSQYSPKLRMTKLNETPIHNSKLNNIQSIKFLSTGSLISGGLSNFWGAVSPKFSLDELGCSNAAFKEFEKSYENIAKRIGINGTNDKSDRMAKLNGSLINIQDPLEISSNAQFLLNKYNLTNKNLNFFLGLNRSAVLSNSIEERFECNYCESCMSNCKSGSIYSSNFDLIKLNKNPKFKYKDNSHVIKIIKHKTKYKVLYKDLKNNKVFSIFSKNIFLAAGTITSTKFALSILKKYNTKYNILTTPMISMGLFIPKKVFDYTNQEKFGLGQLSFSFKLNNKKDIYGLLYDGTTFAQSDLSNKFPLSKSTNLVICNTLSSSFMIGLVYLPGDYTDNKLFISNDDEIKVNVTGAYKKEIEREFKEIRKVITTSFRKLGAFLIPGSFQLSKPGADVHYASTLPMGIHTSENGELKGSKGVYLVDGSCLKNTPAKNLTFTIMANADRIARKFSL